MLWRKIIKTLYFIPFFLLLVPVYAHAQPLIKHIVFKAEGTKRYVVVESNEPIQKRGLFRLTNPERLVLDMEHVANREVALPSLPAGDIVKALRFGHFNGDISRIVLELAGGVIDYEVHYFSANATQPHRLVLEIMTDEKAGTISAVNKSQPAYTQATTTGFVPLPEAKPEAVQATAGSRPVIVIDAGHGGKDPGATGHNGTLEKTLTLQYALALEEALKRSGRYQPVMTRSDDTFIFLHDRVRLAREARGHLFISLHADSAGEASARGISVYTVSEESSDREAEILAQKENEVDKIGGIQFMKEHPDIADILLDLTTRDSRIKATELATLLVEGFRKKGIQLLKNPSRYAGFRVLKSPDIPSVLIEIGFLSNKQDEYLLKTQSHQQKVVSAIVQTLDSYFARHPLHKK